MTEHLIADGTVRLTVEFDVHKAPKRIYSKQEVLEQIQWHKERLGVLQARVLNGECTE